MSYGRRNYWLTRMSRPGVSHPMLYGCGCGNVGRFNRLATSTKIRFFWLPLSTMKCNGFSCTHICERKSCSPSYVSSGSSGWIFVVEMVMLGSTSMIFLPWFVSDSDSDPGSDSGTFISVSSDCFAWHSSVLCMGLLWSSHHFPWSFFVFQLPFFACGLGWLSEGWIYLLLTLFCELGFPLPYFWFVEPNSGLFFCLNFCSIFTAYR